MFWIFIMTESHLQSKFLGIILTHYFVMDKVEAVHIVAS